MEESEINDEDERLTLKFGKTLQPGHATLKIEFFGPFNKQLKGVYKSVYAGKKESVLIMGNCKRCFPCWDDPFFKATFKTTIHAPIDQIVLSNMPVESEIIQGCKKIVSFYESVLMSTYIFSVVIGHFAYIEGISTDGVLVRAYAREQDVKRTQFALDITLKVLPFYKNFFEFGYPLPKLDLVCIPEFDAGAMENFGLTVYRDIAMLVADNAPVSRKQEIAAVAAHEAGHMWFGNIVTLKWWSHSWLNEGMATWVSYLAVQEFFPEWNVWKHMNDSMFEAFSMDALKSSLPIECKVEHPRQIAEAFSAISYEKGASLMYMLQQYLGLDGLQQGFIDKYKFKNATTADFWELLSQVTLKPVKQVMTCWGIQTGFPLIVASLKNGVLELEQSRFLASGDTGDEEWTVPITCCWDSYDNQASFLLEGRRGSFPIPKTPKKFIKLNVGQTGFYRVQYEEQLDTMLGESINELKSTDRLGYLDDVFSLCRSRKKPLSSYAVGEVQG